MGKKQDMITGLMAALTDHEQRIAALEAHITDLEERLNDRGFFTGGIR